MSTLKLHFVRGHLCRGCGAAVIAFLVQGGGRFGRAGNTDSTCHVRHDLIHVCIQFLLPTDTTNQNRPLAPSLRPPPSSTLCCWSIPNLQHQSSQNNNSGKSTDCSSISVPSASDISTFQSSLPRPQQSSGVWSACTTDQKRPQNKWNVIAGREQLHVASSESTKDAETVEGI